MDTLIEHILPSYKIKLNSLGNTNDPKEKMISILHSIKNIGYAGEYLEISTRLHYYLDNDCRICCFSSDYIEGNKEFKGYNLPRMWATYGDNHKGVCLKIDYDKFCQENEIDNEVRFISNVEYATELNHNLIKTDKQFDNDYEKVTLQLIRDNLDKLFFLKHRDWNTEREIRYLSLKANSYCSIKGSIDSIIVGMDFKRRYLPSIITQMSPVTDIDKIEYDHKHGQLFLFKIKKINVA